MFSKFWAFFRCCGEPPSPYQRRNTFINQSFIPWYENRHAADYLNAASGPPCMSRRASRRFAKRRPKPQSFDDSSDTSPTFVETPETKMARERILADFKMNYASSMEDMENMEHNISTTSINSSGEVSLVEDCRHCRSSMRSKKEGPQDPASDSDTLTSFSSFPDVSQNEELVAKCKDVTGKIVSGEILNVDGIPDQESIKSFSTFEEDAV